MLPRDLLRDSGIEELRLQLANSVARTILACVILRSMAHFANYGNHSRQPLFFYRHESRIRSNASRMRQMFVEQHHRIRQSNSSCALRSQDLSI